MNRHGDWLDQAERDLRHSHHSIAVEDFEWAAFAAHQAAEKAVKALIMKLNGEGWGHSTTKLLQDLVDEIPVPADVIDAGKRIDKHYIPTRYPDGFPLGSPGSMYTRAEAQGALADAQAIVAFCRNAISQDR